MLARIGSSTVTISSRLCRQYRREVRVRVHTNSAVQPHTTTSAYTRNGQNSGPTCAMALAGSAAADGG
jgi:hypothetical protein